MDEGQFAALSRKIDILTNLLALTVVKDRSISDQVRMLSSTGLKVKEIAEILGRTENQIYVTQTRLRKKNVSSTTDNEPPTGNAHDDV